MRRCRYSCTCLPLEPISVMRRVEAITFRNHLPEQASHGGEAGHLQCGPSQGCASEPPAHGGSTTCHLRRDVWLWALPCGWRPCCSQPLLVLHWPCWAARRGPGRRAQLGLASPAPSAALPRVQTLGACVNTFASRVGLPLAELPPKNPNPVGTCTKPAFPPLACCPKPTLTVASAKACSGTRRSALGLLRCSHARRWGKAGRAAVLLCSSRTSKSCGLHVDDRTSALACSSTNRGRGPAFYPLPPLG